MITDSQQRSKETRIGGSDAPIILGLSHFTSKEELYYLKTGILEKENLDEVEAVKIGKRIEAFIRQLYCEETNDEIINVDEEEYVNPKYPWAVAHIDGLIKSNKYETYGIFEAKNTSAYMVEHWKNGPPIVAAVQVLHYMAVVDVPWAVVAGLIGGNKFKWFKIERTPEIEQAIAEIMTHEEAFYNSVINRVPPETRPLNLIEKLWPNHESGKFSKIDSIALPQHFNPMLGYLECKSIIAGIEKIKDQFEAEIKDVMKDDERAIYCDENQEVSYAEWKNVKDSTVIDSQKLKEKYPDIYNECSKPKKGGRRFTVKLAKDVSIKGVENSAVKQELKRIIKGE